MDTEARRRSLARDALVAGGAAALAIAGVQIAHAAGWQPRDLSGFVVTILLTAATWVVGRRAPATTLAVVAAIVAAPMWSFAVTGVRIVPLVLAGLLATMSGVRAAFVVPVYALGILLGLVADTTTLMWRFRDWGVAAVLLYGDTVQKLLLALVAGIVPVLGHVMRRQRRAAVALRIRTAELAALRREEDARVVAETRTAIARDIHDVVAHHMAAVVVTAQSAAADPRRDSERLHATMLAIAAEGREALTAMRGAVRMLRTDATDAAAERASDISPLVAELADRVRATGRTVVVEGSPGSVPQFAQVAVARIVQEALTNVMLHSDARAVTVAFTTEHDGLVLRVADDGSSHVGASSSSGGHGVTGMRERALALGGTLTADAAPEGGWTVTATVPVRRR